MAKSKLVQANKKIENIVLHSYKTIENSVLKTYEKIEDAFVERYLMHEGESVADAKKRLKGEKR